MLLNQVTYVFSLVEKNFPTQDQNLKTGTYLDSIIFLEQKLTRTLSLYVNVWAPANANSNSNLPVKVWIYGGGQQGGGIQNPLFNGCSLAAHDTLLVSINYRLGPLGYLTIDDAGIGGNFAIQDLILGLEWVQSHIAAFGGDPVSFGLPYPDLEADANYISNRKRLSCLVNPPERRTFLSSVPYRRRHHSSMQPFGNQVLVHNSPLRKLRTLSGHHTQANSIVPQM